MNALFVGRDYTSLDDGGKIVTKRNIDFLKEICENVDEILRPRGTMFTFFKNIIFKEGYGYTKEMKRRFKSLINSKQYDFVWLDGSCDSTIAKECKKRNIPVICFYHNVETNFYKSKAKNSKSIFDRVFAKYIHSIEYQTSIYSKFHVLLNERDAKQIEDLYGIKGDLILPTSFPIIDYTNLNQTFSSESYLLFVGSNFWANIEGMSYFLKEIAPYINRKVKIIGSICDNLKDQILPENISLEGRVENLDSYYADALAVISPILSGSGTKTKTIEALRYGKTIIGSPEALMGVPEKYYSCIGVLCKEKEDYIKAINELPNEKFNKNSYHVFKEIFSDEAVFKRLRNFIDVHFHQE